MKQLEWIQFSPLYSYDSSPLARLNISYPMLFKLINGDRNAHTHAGVLEFIAEEGRVYLPHWVSLSC
jgi:Ubiquitin fusion degradation protein UFD1